jgi:hypothetical protein
MKVAFCLSGQLRTWRKCYSSWLSLFEKFKEQVIIDGILQDNKFSNETFEVDFFMHTWEFNTIPHYKWNVDWSEPDPHKRRKLLEPFNNTYTPLERSEIDEIVTLLNPKDYIVEGWDISKNREVVMDYIATSQTLDKNPIKGHLSWAGSQFYSILKSAYLKRKYEIENGFEYDLCIKCRFDLEFDENIKMIFARDFEIPKKRTIYSVHNRSLDRYPFNAIGDIFYYSDSQTFDLLTSLYDNIPYIEKSAFGEGVSIEEVMTYIVRMFQLNNICVDSAPNLIRED